MEELKKDLERICGPLFKDLQKEVDLFMLMMDSLEDDKKSSITHVFERNLRWNNLTIEKINDPFYLEQTLQFFKEIKQSNFDHFDDGDRTGNYNHYSHGYSMNHIINPLKEKLNEIVAFKEQYFDEIYLYGIKTKLEETPEEYIKIDFNEFGLPYYANFFKRINRAAADDVLFTIIPVLLRCVVEDILHLILLKSLHKKHIELYYDVFNNRIRNLSQLIALFDLLRKKEFKRVVSITDDIIKALNEIRSRGNYSIHDVDENITRSFVDQWNERIEITLRSLLKSYLVLKDETIEISPEREQFIIEKLSIKKKPIKLKESNTKSRIKTRRKSSKK